MLRNGIISLRTSHPSHAFNHFFDRCFSRISLVHGAVRGRVQQTAAERGRVCQTARCEQLGSELGAREGDECTGPAVEV